MPDDIMDKPEIEEVREKRKAGRPRLISQEAIDELLHLHDEGWGYITIATDLRSRGYKHIYRERVRYYIHKYRGRSPNSKETL